MAVLSMVTGLFSVFLLYRRHVVDHLVVPLESLSFIIWIELAAIDLGLSDQNYHGMVAFAAQSSAVLWTLTSMTILGPFFGSLIGKCWVSRCQSPHDWSNHYADKAQDANQ